MAAWVSFVNNITLVGVCSKGQSFTWVRSGKVRTVIVLCGFALSAKVLLGFLHQLAYLVRIGV